MYSPQLIVDNPALSLSVLEIYSQYLASLDHGKAINDTRNAVVRYFIPSVGGPIPSARKRRPLAPGEVETALQFLKTVPLEQLIDAPDWASQILDKLDSSPSQRERVRQDLRNLVNWARDRQYLPSPKNIIPEYICDHIKVGLYEGLPLVKADSQQIVERFLDQAKDESLVIDATNAIIRFFVPACGGPVPFNKPALDSEIQAGFNYLRTVPLEYLDEALTIVTSVLQTLDYSQTHGTRIRNALRQLLRWARAERYLPDPKAVAPWGGELISKDIFKFEQSLKEPPSAFELYQQYRSSLEKISGGAKEINAFQSSIIRYLVPALGGTIPKKRRATASEIQVGFNYLHQVSLEQLFTCIDQIDSDSKTWSQVTVPHRSVYSRLRRWQRWITEQYCQNETEEVIPEFNTFHKRSIKREKRKPGLALHKNSCPVHALCAKNFPEDYINFYLKKQLEDYEKWRRKNDVTPGAVSVELEQIRQVLGWLHRYEGVALEDLSFEKMIAKSQLVFRASECKDYYEYLHKKEIGIQEARDQADQDKQRVECYLEFTGDNPNSQARRLFIVLAMAKFLYRDLLGSDDFLNDRDIPILRRLLDLQAKKKKRGKQTAQTVSYGETSVSWEEAVMVMEKTRLRVEQVLIYRRVQSRQGYVYDRRPDSAIANDLQRFLSVAFSLLVPSRNRTFYDLRIGETFKEGILTKRHFYSVQDLKDRGEWEQYKNQVQFYIHHMSKDYKTGKSMTPALLENGGWWVEIPNISFGEISLYDYIHRWLEWGRGAEGSVHHNFFFRQAFTPQPLEAQAWRSRIKTIFERWSEVPVPPKNLRKMFSTQFSQHSKSAALLLQHSERIHGTDYDMTHTVVAMQPVMIANQQFIQSTLDLLGNNEKNS